LESTRNALDQCCYNEDYRPPEFQNPCLHFQELGPKSEWTCQFLKNMNERQFFIDVYT
jgi:hypothetical protein